MEMSVSPLWYYTIVLQDVIFGGMYVKETWDLSVLFLMTVCESTTIALQIQLNDKILSEYSK